MADVQLKSPEKIALDESWKSALLDFLTSEKMATLKSFLKQEYEQRKTIFPAGGDVFNALNYTSLNQVKIVILGQDPYHGDGQAHGLSFSVRHGVRVPPSLINIYKELHQDTGFAIPQHGNLEPWAKQGVLLLNSVLTVERGRAASHQGRGWEDFTDRVIATVNQECTHVVFMLWGSYAQKKASFVDRTRHLVLSAPHPSPLSAHRGFLGCGHFSKANQYLQSHGIEPIDWAL